MTFRLLTLVYLIGAMVLLAACGSGGSKPASGEQPATEGEPSEIAHAFYEAASRQQREEALALACREAQDDTESLLSASRSFNLYNVTYETIRIEGDTAEVLQIGMAQVGSRRVPIERVIRLKNENGWKYCGAADE